MLIELSAKELAYVTYVVGRASFESETSLSAFEILYDAMMSDVQALMYYHVGAA